jgi:para-nitrobenzyl esterase
MRLWDALRGFGLLATAMMLNACGGGDTASSNAAALAGAPAPLALLTKGGDDRLRRVTQYGPVLGLDQSASSGTLAWLGIPYAKPPVGELRWRPPAEPTPWTDVRSARAFGASCAQGGRMFSPSSTYGGYSLAVRDNLGKPVGSEDCLYLNIWRPAGSSGTLPVIVFIHGGSNVVGYTADPMYDGAALATKANAVVVTLNYRLGLLGWLSLPQLKTGDALTDSGNFGTLDQVQALKFVRNNISAFGGDAGNVTLMGESAGAVNVWALLVSPQAKGLMHKAVSMSGGLAVHSPSESEAYGRNMLQALVIADGKAADAASAQLYLATQSNEQIAAYLRSKNADDLLRVALANAGRRAGGADRQRGDPVGAAVSRGRGQLQQGAHAGGQQP